MSTRHGRLQRKRCTREWGKGVGSNDAILQAWKAGRRIVLSVFIAHLMQTCAYQNDSTYNQALATLPRSCIFLNESFFVPIPFFSQPSVRKSSQSRISISNKGNALRYETKLTFSSFYFCVVFLMIAETAFSPPGTCLLEGKFLF